MRKLLLFLCLTLGSYALYAQQTYTVKVTDQKTGSPVNNASVVIKKAGKGATSNGDGAYTITAKTNDVLEITCVGYKSNTVKLTDATVVNVVLEPSAADLTDVVVIGTRGAARVKAETAVPVDVIKINQVGLSTAKMDLSSILNMSAPSFNYNKQSGADGADHLDLGTLRGLGPDQTLVLVNGKRRHQTAFIALFGTRGRGASGTDMNAFAAGSVDRIEILRDGASAQYGSDAMAGVINVRLRKDVNHWTINSGWSGFYDTKYNSLKSYDQSQYYTGDKVDGAAYALSVNNGFKVGKSGGFINLTFDYLKQGKTFRQVPDTNITTNPKAQILNAGRRAFGDGSVQTDGAMYNMELPLKATKTVFYSFGGYNHKASDAFAYTRNLSGRPKRFPTDTGGHAIFVPSIMHVSSDSEIYYNPHIGTKIVDASLALGFKGVLPKEWNWDISVTGGQNDFQYFGDQTFNASLLGNITKTHFDDGGFKFRQATANLDISKSFKSVMSGLNFAYGAEYRNENYSINAGEEGSYKTYTNPFDLAGGSQGFPGFSPTDVVDATRSVVGVYTDAELNVTNKWLVDGAARFENYSDFGSVVTFKLATRYKVAKSFNLRGSASTGFRAPSLQQINFSNTVTSFNGGQLSETRYIRNTDNLARIAGISNLKEETSVNASLGFSWKPTNNLTITMDGYLVKVKDRVVLSGQFSSADSTLPISLTVPLQALNVSNAIFFANAVNTTNYGLDLVLDYAAKIGAGNFKALIAANIQNVTIDKITVPAALSTTTLHSKTFYSDRDEAFLKASAPKAKMALSLSYTIHKFGLGTNLTYFGKVLLKGFGIDGNGIDPMLPSDANGTLVPENLNYNGKMVTDVFASYKVCKAATIYIGADNIMNVHPDFGILQAARGYGSDNESGGPWDSVQMGFNGRRLFAKLAFSF